MSVFFFLCLHTTPSPTHALTRAQTESHTLGPTVLSAIQMRCFCQMALMWCMHKLNAKSALPEEVHLLRWDMTDRHKTSPSCLEYTELSQGWQHSKRLPLFFCIFLYKDVYMHVPTGAHRAMLDWPSLWCTFIYMLSGLRRGSPCVHLGNMSHASTGPSPSISIFSSNSCYLCQSRGR